MNPIHASALSGTVLLALMPVLAMANPIKTVGTAVVNPGAHTVELRSGYSSDNTASPAHDGRFQTRQMYDYGVNEAYAVRLTAIQDNAGISDYEHNALMFDNRVQMFERITHGFDGGFRLTYLLRDGDKKPDIAEMRWITQVPFYDVYEFRNHVIVQHQVGAGRRSGVMPELRWQVTRPLVERHRIGVEIFNEFGNIRDDYTFDQQGHDAGILVFGPLWQQLRYQAGYRAGISDNAPDHAVKFFVGYDF